MHDCSWLLWCFRQQTKWAETVSAGGKKPPGCESDKRISLFQEVHQDPEHDTGEHMLWKGKHQMRSKGTFKPVCISYLVMTNSLGPPWTSPPGSSVQGILQARILDWVAIPFSRGSSRPRDGTWVSHIAGWFWATMLQTCSEHYKGLSIGQSMTKAWYMWIRWISFKKRSREILRKGEIFPMLLVLVFLSFAPWFRLYVRVLCC